MKKDDKNNHMDIGSKPLTSLSEVMELTKIHLIPFVASLVIYFLVFIPMEQQTFNGMILKCLPIISLQYFVYKFSSNAVGGLGFYDKESIYYTKIFVGLIFACFGDAFLDFPNYFLHGTVSFAVAQIFNIWAFGFEPLNLFLGLKVIGVMSLPLYLIMPNLMKQDLLFTIIATIYALLLKTMVWRAISRLEFGIDNNTDLGKVFGCLGAVSFGLSDATLAINKLYKPVAYAQAIIMFTYYLAQFGIAMSVVSFGSRKSDIKKGK